MHKTTFVFLLCAFLSSITGVKAADGWLSLVKIEKPIAPKSNQGEARRCSEYFFVFPPYDENGLVVNYLLLHGEEKVQTLAVHDQFHVVIDNAESVPKLLAKFDPDGIDNTTITLRLKEADYVAARSCLPKPAKD